MLTANGADDGNAAGTVLGTEEVQRLSDDPDEFLRELQSLAAGAGGPSGNALVTADGFQNRSALPPKSSIAWHHRIVGQSIFAGYPGWVTNGVDLVSVAGACNIPYDIPNILVDLHATTNGVPIATWRSAGDSHTAFAVETFLDDVAQAAAIPLPANTEASL